MHSLESTSIRLEIDLPVIRILDRERHCTWEAEVEKDASLQSDGNRLTLSTADTRWRWSVADDHLIVELLANPGISRTSLVPRFRAVGEKTQALIPQYQGALIRGGTQTWSSEGCRGGHTNLSLGMLGLTSRAAGLLLVPDQLVGWIGKWGNDGHGPFASYDATLIETHDRIQTAARIYPTAPGVTALALRYRRLMQDRARWVSWQEKIDARPALKRLFGSLIAFIGYVQDPETNYVRDTQRLRTMGFESMLIYPARFAHYTPFTMADGHPPIHLSDDQIPAMQAAGALVAPWAWFYEGIDDGSDRMRSIFRHTRSGIAGGWAMDQQHWHHICAPFQTAHARERFQTDMNAMDWMHFDVNATHPITACWNREHASHAGRPMAPDEVIAETNRLFSPVTIGNRIVSSEGFNDAFTATYDIGSTKMLPLDELCPDTVPVPLTMLIFHDCCVHDWWEMHNYNANPCWGVGNPHTGRSRLGRVGSGLPHLKAAVDALNGLPPNVFPFGMQYGWVDRPGGKTYPFRMRLDDAEVSEALAAALPVTQLHRRVGQLALTDFTFIDDHPMVQQTTFADGTRVIANLAPEPLDTSVGRLSAHSWRSTQT